MSLGHGDQASVAQVLSRPNEYSGGLEALERAGVKVAYDGRYTPPKKKGVFFSHQNILRYLLKGTQWADQSIDQILLRLPSAAKKQYECGGHKPWGVFLDWKMIDDNYLVRGLGDNQEDF